MWSCQEWRHATVTAPERNLQWEVPAQDIRWQLLWVIYHSQARQLLHSIPPVVHTIIVNSLPYILLVCDICQLIPDHPFPWAKFIPTLIPLCSLPCLGLSPSMLRKMLQLWMKNALWLGFCWVLRLTSDWKKKLLEYFLKFYLAQSAPSYTWLPEAGPVQEHFRFLPCVQKQGDGHTGGESEQILGCFV